MTVLVASGPATPLTSPFDGSVRGELATSTYDDVVVAAQRAREAGRRWAARSLTERSAVLLEFHDRLLDRRDEFVDLVHAEAGKARLNAVEEVLHAALTARYYGRTAPRVLGPERGTGLFPLLTRVERRYLPKGVVGVISPWNYPLTLPISDALPALAAGNGVVIKPDAQTPLAVLAGIDLLVECGLPEGLCQVVNGPGDQVGPWLIDQVDYLCFTGSTAAGQRVAVQCAERLIGCSLELGGKNPLLILEDADLHAAVSGAVRACFANAGQLCVAAERIYVVEAVADRFIAAFVEATAALRLGSSAGFDIDVGPLINAAQLDRIQHHVTDAVGQGAQLLVGGRPRPDLGPFFFEPTIVTGVRPGMLASDQETFGPVVSVYRVADEQEAITQANNSAYGLNASVWTRDLDRGRRVAAQINCGTVNINEGFGATFGSLDAPMGGLKSSGLGRRQGVEGIRRFVDVQSVASQSGLPIAPSHGLGPRGYTSLMTQALRLLKKVGRA